MALNDLINQLFSLGNPITTGPPEQTSMRGIISTPLTVAARQSIAPTAQAAAEQLVFDTTADCARHLCARLRADAGVGQLSAGEGVPRSKRGHIA